MLGSFLNVSSDVSAIDDVSFTFDSSNYRTSIDLCSNCSSDYNYIFIQSTPFSLSTFNSPYFFPLSLDSRLSFNIEIGPGVTSTLLDFSTEFPSSVSYVYNTSLYSYFVSLRGSVTVSLLTNNPFSSSVPSGSISIIENGIYDVSQYAEAVVNVPPEVVQGDYHDDLVSINNSILIVAAVGLVIYFFYAIYRMILGGRR